MVEDYPHNRKSSSETSSGDEKVIGLPRASINAPILTPEEAELARLGYKQEFKREFSWISTFSFALSISGLLATVLFCHADLDLTEIGHHYIWVSFNSWRTSRYCLVLVLLSCIPVDMIGLLVALLVCA